MGLWLVAISTLSPDSEMSGCPLKIRGHNHPIPCFKEKIYPMDIINQGKGDLFDQVSIADLPWL